LTATRVGQAAYIRSYPDGSSQTKIQGIIREHQNNDLAYKKWMTTLMRTIIYTKMG